MPDVIPAGKGMKNVQLLVVDLKGEPRLCGVAEQGEIFVRAGGLAEGYLGSDDLTDDLNKKKFIPNFFLKDSDKWQKDEQRSLDSAGHEDEPWRQYWKGPRDRLYRSGDLGYVFSESIFPLLDRIWSRETCLKIVCSVDMLRDS